MAVESPWRYSGVQFGIFAHDFAISRVSILLHCRKISFAVLNATGTKHKVVCCLKYTGQRQVGNLSVIMFEKRNTCCVEYTEPVCAKECMEFKAKTI